MTLALQNESTEVPISGDRSVRVEPQQPWPSAYRGSRYSLVSDDDFATDEALVKWKQRDLSIFTDPPRGLRQAMISVGKSEGFGSFRITARREVITKVQAEKYDHVDQAPISRGWVPVYLGVLSGELNFDTVDTNPESPSGEVSIWTGFPFNHGERWSVSHDGKLIWKWRDYRFESAFDHSGLVAKYGEYRPNPGRLYVTEHGHIWVNIPHDGVIPSKRTEVREAIESWKQDAENRGDTTTLRLVNRRLVATSRTDDPADGHLPIRLGHLCDFDDGVVPRPVVDDEEYYLDVGEYETVWE